MLLLAHPQSGNERLLWDADADIFAHPGPCLEWAGVAFTFSDIVSLLPDGEMTEEEKQALIDFAEREQARRPGAGG